MASTETLQPDMNLSPDKMATNLIYGASLVSIALSLLSVRKNLGIATFLGLWAPTILGLGILMKENRFHQAVTH